MAQSRRLFRQNDEDRLRDFLCVLRMAGLTQGDGVNQIDVARHQFGKRLIGMIFSILPQQRAVIHGFHSGISVRPPEKGDNLFSICDLRLMI